MSGTASSTLSALDAIWIFDEGINVVAGGCEQLVPLPADRGRFVLAVDGHPVAYTQPDGRELDRIG